MNIAGEPFEAKCSTHEVQLTGELKFTFEPQTKTWHPDTSEMDCPVDVELSKFSGPSAPEAGTCMNDESWVVFWVGDRSARVQSMLEEYHELNGGMAEGEEELEYLRQEGQLLDALYGPKKG
jgi:hypothetical protein